MQQEEELPGSLCFARKEDQHEPAHKTHFSFSDCRGSLRLLHPFRVRKAG